MSCPGCSGTMQLMFMDRERTIHHCPRCGATRSVLFGHTDDVVPRLVERCRQFELVLAAHGDAICLAEWNRLGIAELIDTPEDRG